MRKEIRLVRRLFPFIRPYPGRAISIILMGILASLSEGVGISLMIPLLQSLESETFQNSQQSGLIALLESPFRGLPPEQRLVIIAITIVIITLLKNLLVYTNKALFGWFNQQIGHQLRSRLFQKFLNLPYADFQTKDSGELLNILATESWQVSRALEMLVNIVISLCTLLVFTVIMLLLSWRLILVVSLLTLIISLLVQKVTQRTKILGQQAVVSNSQLATLMHEGLLGMRTIRAFGQESYEQQRFNRSSQKVKQIFWQMNLLYGLVDPLHEGLSTFLVVGVLVFLLLKDPTSISTILTFMFMLYRLQPHFKLIDYYRVDLLSTDASVKAVMEFLEQADKPDLLLGAVTFSGLEKEIKFKQVNFYYRNHDSPALKNISLNIPKGKTTAIVGSSGAGKSTLIDLLCRFYDVTTGEITVDGINLKDLRLRDWREKIAIVSQDIHIFSSTIRENIVYGKLEATEAQIKAAAKYAHAHDFIVNLTHGYDTPVGDRGIRLSGGQRQRIALARAIVRNPEILILDEATNALDTISEHLIQEALDDLTQNRTTIVIAHRLSTIKRADQIIVLEKGRVIEQGNLHQLLQLNGIFARLYQLQYQTN